jgi:hypothetical protein
LVRSSHEALVNSNFYWNKDYYVFIFTNSLNVNRICDKREFEYVRLLETPQILKIQLKISVTFVILRSDSFVKYRTRKLDAEVAEPWTRQMLL